MLRKFLSSLMQRRKLGEADGESEEEINPTQWPHWPSGSLPHSLSLQHVSLYRCQLKRYLELGPTWYRMFWDVERKWTAKNRFAGEGTSPGHFFSVSPFAVLKELGAYGVQRSDYKNYALLRFEMSLDDILDLTDREALLWFYKRHFGGEDWHWAILLDALLEQQLGGDDYIDYVGQKAVEDGYKGIAFFSARSIDNYWPDAGSLQFDHSGSLGSRDLSLVGYVHEAMRKDPKCINVVIFFGHNVVRAAHRFSSNITVTEDGKSLVKAIGEENRLFEAAYSDIDIVFQNDPTHPANEDLSYENLRDRVDRIVWRGVPGIVHRSSSPWIQRPPVR